MNKNISTIDKTLHSLTSKVFYTDAGREVVTTFTAERAIYDAYRRGRRDFIKNIPELKWIDGGQYYYADGEDILICHADTEWGQYNIYYTSSRNYELMFEADTLKVSKSISELKFIAKKDYKRRIHKTLGLIHKK